MTERRFNYAIAGPPPEAWTAHLKWSARVLRFAGVDVSDKELLAEIDHEDREQQAQRPIGRRIPPDSRKHPPQHQPALYEPNLSIPFKTRKKVDLRLGLVQVFPTGVSFQLIARAPDQQPDQGVVTGPEAMNLGFRLKSGQPHRIRLIVSVDPRRSKYGFHGGTVLANSSSPYDFPEDPNAPWLAGGSDRCTRVGDGDLEFAASYFLSPVPPKGKLVFTVAYPEFDIDVTNIVLDAAQFTQEPSD